MHRLQCLYSWLLGSQTPDKPVETETAARSVETPPTPAEKCRKTAMSSLLSGIQAIKAEDFETGLTHLNQSLIDFVNGDDRRNAALVQKTISLTLTQIRDPASVRRSYERAISMLRQAGLDDEAGRLLIRRAHFEDTQGDGRAAISYIRQATALLKDAGCVPGEIEAHCSHAQFLKRKGFNAQAIELLERADWLLGRYDQ